MAYRRHITGYDRWPLGEYCRWRMETTYSGICLVRRTERLAAESEVWNDVETTTNNSWHKFRDHNRCQRNQRWTIGDEATVHELWARAGRPLGQGSANGLTSDWAQGPGIGRTKNSAAARHRYRQTTRNSVTFWAQVSADD